MLRMFGQACRSVLGRKIIETQPIVKLQSFHPISRCVSTSPVMCADSSQDELVESDTMKEIRDEASVGLLNTDHRVFVIQPFIKWGQKMKRNTTREFMLAESVALIESLQGWRVVDSQIVSLLTFDKKYFFGKGNLKLLQDKIRGDHRITAVFVSVDFIKRYQQKLLQDIFKVPVFDRYMIVIQLFKAHAITREAKLQIAIAELPYLWTRCRTIEDATNMNISKGFLDSRRMVLMEREQKLKRALNKLKGHRELLRNNHERKKFPTVAVVGYTNCGKTTLIKALTDDDNLVPRNQLFATLDVTTHEGLLPNKLRVLYIDTIGFISNIPTSLLEPFKVTLEDAMLADIIIHVVDLSNPDYVQQKEHVDETLQHLEIEDKLLENVLTVGNKIDALPSEHVVPEDYDLVVSATKGTGLTELKHRVQEMLVDVTGRKMITMRVRNGGREYLWLMKHATVSKIIEDEKSAEHLLLDVVISEAALNKFKHEFVASRKRG